MASESGLYRRNPDGSLTPIGDNGHVLEEESAVLDAEDRRNPKKADFRDGRKRRKEDEGHLETKWDFLAFVAKQFGFNAVLVIVMIGVCIFLYKENGRREDAFLSALQKNTNALTDVGSQQGAMAEAQRQTNGRLDTLTELMKEHLNNEERTHR